MTTGALDLHLVIEFCFAIYFALAHAKSQQQKPTYIIHIYKQNALRVNNGKTGQVISLKEAANVPCGNV